MKNQNDKEITKCEERVSRPLEKNVAILQVCCTPGVDVNNPKEEENFQTESTRSDLIKSPFPVIPHFSTNAIHAGRKLSQQEDIQRCKDDFKSDPTRESAERCLALLEDAKHCVLVSSEKAGVLITCHILHPGDHVICVGDIEGEFGRCFVEVVDKMNVSTTFLESCGAEEVTASIQSNTKLLWLENPTNPTLRILPVLEIIREVRNRIGDVIVAVDNTILSPFYQRPLTLGADISFHSASAYVDGGSDSHLGVIITNDDALNSKIRSTQNILGLTPSQLDCFLLARSVKSLSLRMQEHSRSALRISRCLQDCAGVNQVYYPGLPSHPHHELCTRQASGFGGVVSFSIKGNIEKAEKFVSNLTIFTCQEGIGGYESRVCLFPEMTTSGEGESEVLVRLSIGLEDCDDLLNDLKLALQAPIFPRGSINSSASNVIT